MSSFLLTCNQGWLKFCDCRSSKNDLNVSFLVFWLMPFKFDVDISSLALKWQGLIIGPLLYCPKWVIFNGHYIASETLERRLNLALCVLQTYFRISLQPIFNLYLFLYEFFYMLLSFILCNFLVRILKYLLKNLKMFFCPQKVEKNTSKSCILMAVGSFFSLQPRLPKTAQNFISIL